MPLSDPAVLQAAVQQALQQSPPQQQQPSPSSSGIGPMPYIAAIGGQAADIGSTLYKLHHGYGEANFGGSVPLMLAIKAGLGVGMPFMMHKLAAEGHPTAAKAIGYITGAGGAIPAAYNLSQPNLK